MDFDDYNLDAENYDEMFLSDGAPREHCRLLYETLKGLSAEELGGIQERITRSFLNEGITFTVYGDEEADERIIPSDCLPRILSGAEWRQLESGLTQRLGALNRFLEDIYNEARIIADGVIPVEMVRGCPQTVSRCAVSPHPTAPGSPFVVPTWCVPTTASWCWRTTCGSPRVFRTWSPIAKR